MSHQPENISAGTQIVALVEARGPNGSLVHRRGAVGVDYEAANRFLIKARKQSQLNNP